MRLPRYLAISLCLHICVVVLLSSGDSERDAKRGPAQDRPVLQVLARISPPAVAPELNPISTTAPSPQLLPATEATAAPAAPLASSSEEYLPNSGVEQRAQAVKIAPLIIPQRPYLERKKGKIRLRVYIDEAGRVRQADILLADPPGIYEQAALDALAATIFLPARNSGRPVKSYKDIEIDIDPYESIRTP